VVVLSILLLNPFCAGLDSVACGDSAISAALNVAPVDVSVHVNDAATLSLVKIWRRDWIKVKHGVVYLSKWEDCR
jgi:hypothetical protein